MTINAAADAFVVEDQMGLGGWVQIGSVTFLFSQTWNKTELQPFLNLPKSLQRYITSWETLAQLGIVSTVHNKSSQRPGIIDIQSGSDNTGAEANINHGFSTTEVLSDIIKLVCIKQIQYNTFLNIHQIPGEKNVDADDLSWGRTSNFDPKSRTQINLVEFFDPTPFPRYINAEVQWGPNIHSNVKKGFFLPVIGRC